MRAAVLNTISFVFSVEHSSYEIHILPSFGFSQLHDNLSLRKIDQKSNRKILRSSAAEHANKSSFETAIDSRRAAAATKDSSSGRRGR